jgi:hypothetical protein
MWRFWPRGTGKVEPGLVAPIAEVNEMRLLQLQARVQDAEQIIRDQLADPPLSRGAVTDLLLEVMVALGVMPAAEPDPPVIPGRKP